MVKHKIIIDAQGNRFLAVEGKTGIRKYLALRTVAEYADYRKKRKNKEVPPYRCSARRECRPQDGITIRKLAELTDAELLAAYEMITATKQYSRIEAMYAAGFSMTWTEFKTVLEYRGLI